MTRVTPLRLAQALLAMIALAASAVASAVASPHPARRGGHGTTSTAQPPTRGALYRDGQTERYLLGGRWLYRADPGDAGEAQGWWRDPSSAGWSETTVPGIYNLGDYSNASYRGTVGWYRRDFILPKNAFVPYVPTSARRWIVRFESINYRATIWLNGRRLGGHIGPNLPFELTLPSVHRGVNRLVVKVDNRRLPGDLPPGPGNGWWNYGGLLREVYLRPVQRADISQVQVRTLLGCRGCAARIEERVLVRNPTATRQRVRLVGSYGGARLRFGGASIGPHQSSVERASVRIGRPRLWSPDHPALYRATLTLLDSSGRRLSGYFLERGICTITVHSGRLTLNGRLLNLRGVDLREQDVSRGGALDPAHLRRLVAWTRELGATVIRSDPLNPQINELADRYGLLIWSDVPVTRGVEAAPALSLLEQNIAANQFHPSILVWNIANELPAPTKTGDAGYISTAVALAHRLDPTRPASMAIVDWPGLRCQAAYAPLDVIGVNEYFGWYNAGAGSTDDRDALSPFLDNLRACYPHQALFVSEFGFDGSRAGPVEERGTYDFQANSAAFHLGVFATKPWLSGAIYFLLQDAASFPGYGGGNPYPMLPFSLKGLITLSGQKKPAWGVVAGSYHHTVQIAR